MRKPEVKANVLLVNDRPDQLVALATVLGPLEGNLVLARSGEEALRQLLHHDFAVVLLDVQMPGLDGFETASLIRQRGRSRSTPIIFVTAYGQGDEQVARSYSLGAVDLIQAPIVPEILRTKVATFVQLYKKSEELRLLTEAAHQREMDAAREKLEAEAKRNLFFVLSIDLLAVAGFDGCFKQTNPAWEKTLGWKQEELRGRPLFEFAHPEDRNATLQQLDTLRQGTAVTYFEHRFACRDGHYRWLGWTAAPFAAEKLIYVFARDITERRLAEQKICVLNHKLEARIHQVTAVNRELEAFNNSIAHDLRAPLRSIRSFAQMLEKECGPVLPPAGREYASRLIRSAAYMDQLLGDLLEYSRLGRSELPAEPVRLEPVIQEVLETLAPEIEAKAGKVEVQTPLLPVKAHPPTLKQVLSNLISNALKFVPPNTPPRVRLWTEPRTDGGSKPCPGPKGGGQTSCGEFGILPPPSQQNDSSSSSPQESAWIRLWVADNGIGIEADQHEKIFGLFERVHTAESYSGTGMGLALVRKGVERMGGRVGVQSETGQGSRFWLELPAAVESLAELHSQAA